MADTPERDAAERAKAEARSLGEEIKSQGAAAAGAARDTAREYADRARHEAYARGEAYREHAADETSKVAAALRKASEDLSDGSPQERFVAQIADGVAEAADRVRGMTLDEVARETTGFARRHPAAFLGGAALVGFAAARFLKASSRHGPDSYEMADSPRPAPTGYGSATAPMPTGTSGSSGPGAVSNRVPEPATRPAGATTATSPSGTPGGATPTGGVRPSTATDSTGTPTTGTPAGRPTGASETKPV
ncbi:hypothetical protein [Roseitranquillus sediminis]|uniref:hypothetical protein n=1 Tax=Roseitranquillus sediminis TaxID=2809051 RepID=UPI001D0C68DF|nr:hypothetical protein [Roseitranquillus sediminis]MBM9593146.1 hypothetical protein [Roseitranquillus sediminis]